MLENLKWGFLGVGDIANEMANVFKKNGKEIYSVANRTYEKSLKFGEKYGVKKVYTNIKDIFSDENVDIIYVATPHNTHKEYIIEGLKNNKHILCEKAITLNSEELSECVEMAEKKGLILGEAMTIYNMPLYEKILDYVKEREMGPLKMIQVNFGSYKEYDLNNRFFNRKLAGGALLDIGVYAISLVNLFMVERAENIVSQVKMSESGVDEQVGILLMNDLDEMATVSLTLRGKQPKRAVIAYERAYVEILDYPRANKCKIFYTESGNVEEIELGTTENALKYEYENMEKSVLENKNYMKIRKTVEVMEIMTELREKWGLKYPEEERI